MIGLLPFDYAEAWVVTGGCTGGHPYLSDRYIGCRTFAISAMCNQREVLPSVTLTINICPAACPWMYYRLMEFWRAGRGVALPSLHEYSGNHDTAA